MMDSQNETDCPFGEELQKYWNRLSEPEKKMQLDKEALYSLILQEPGRMMAKRVSGEHVIDAFCGAGGSAITFALEGKRVTAIELDERRLDMAKFNAKLFNVQDRIKFLQGDALEIAPNLNDGDSIFLAPPWGGPAYAKKELFTLDCFEPDGKVLFDMCIRLDKEIVMQAPKNLDLNQLRQFNRPFHLYEDRLKGELLSYTLIMDRIAVN